MPYVLLRPYALSLKNRLFAAGIKGTSRFQDLFILVICLLIMFGIYGSLSSFLQQSEQFVHLGNNIPQKIIHFASLGLFLLLIFSNLIGAISFFFAARDLPLILTTPVSTFRLYLSRMLVTLVNSSWVLVMFGTPALFAYYHALKLPPSFILAALVAFIPFIVIPATIAGVVATVFINVIPENRLRELIGGAMIFFGVVLFYAANTSPSEFVSNQDQVEQAIETVASLDNPSPSWLPSYWFANVCEAFIVGKPKLALQPILSLYLAMFAMIGIGYSFFRALFFRGWSLSLRGTRAPKIRRSALLAKLGSLIPLPQQFRGMLLKEQRMFVRDPAQCFQLLLLLMLTFVYLYNFKALRSVASDNAEAHVWWQTVLCIANIALGGCVIAAVSTRFVFPSPSLEGQAYWVVRSAPMGIKNFLLIKFWIWLFPIGTMATILMVAGAWAIGVTPGAAFLSGVLGLTISVGIVGLGVGTGAVYAMFDWDSPAQVAASFGSLVFMLLSMGVVTMSLLPSSVLIVLTTVPGVALQLSRFDYLMTISCASFLAFFINFSAARWALNSGAQALSAREK